MTNPEEINRICTDHVATLLLMSTEGAAKELEKEGLLDRAHYVGDPMYDAFVGYKNKVDIHSLILQTLEGDGVSVPREFYYLTCHREENTNGDKALYEICKAMDQLDVPTVYLVHPRNKERARRLKLNHLFDNIILTEPVGYLESICLVNNAKKNCYRFRRLAKRGILWREKVCNNP